MKICNECGIEFKESVSFEKYCSLVCRKRFNRKKEILKRKIDIKYRQKRQKKENERKKRKRAKDKSYREKHNSEEKQRYRKKHGIESDDDLKCAPKGSGTITQYGYRQIIRRGHPNARKDGGMLEHVFVMSEYLNRPLQKHERVHHKNGMRADNRIENLELWSKSQPYGQRVEDKLKWCKEFLEEYGYCVIVKEKSN